MSDYLFNDKSVLITGGTGSFGHAFADYILQNTNVKKLILLSRDEMKQWHMAQKFKDPRLRFFIGDVRDGERLRRAFSGVDYIIHAAATKIVPTAEYNPIECVKTNVNGAMNVINAAIDCGVSKVVALSTDKASSPINLYGATKLISDKLFVASNAYSGEHGCKFSVVRYGNVIGSRGSVIPFFANYKEKSELPITDPKMTRFMISLEDGVKLVVTALEKAIGGEIFVKKIPSMNIMKIAKAVRPDLSTKIIGIREGEKLHEQMISVEDSKYTYSYDDHYRILPLLHEWYLSDKYIQDGIKVAQNFYYASDNNSDWMTIEQLRAWMDQNKHNLGKF